MTDRNDEPPAARPRRRKQLKLTMPWDGWFDLSPEARAREESTFLDYLEDIYGDEDCSNALAMFESGYKDAIRVWHEEKMRRCRSRGS